MLVTMSESERRNHSHDRGEVLAAQKQYYDLRAPDYLVSTKPPDRAGRGVFPPDLVGPVFEDLRPVGDVLELACGPGPLFTSELAATPTPLPPWTPHRRCCDSTRHESRIRR